MKLSNFVLSLTAAILILVSPGLAQQKDTNEQKRNSGSEQVSKKITDETIDQFLKAVKEKDPRREKELQQLRKKNPEKLKEIILREQSEENKPPRKSRRARIRERIHQMQQEHLEWLKENYPEEAKELTDIKDKNPELFADRISLSRRKFHRIKEAQEENNTELVEVLKKEIEINKQLYDLVHEIRSTKNNKKKERLTAQLNDVLSQKYDIIVQKKQFAYEDLLKKLEELRNDIKKSKENVKRWQDPEFKEKNIQARMKDLLSKNPKFDWDQ